MIKYKKYLNENAFSNITLESCYWAGFIAADGNVARFGNRVKVRLWTPDKKHLILLSNFLYGKNFVKVYKNNTCKNKKEVYLECNSEKIKNDLSNNFNIIPNKSLILEPPKNLTTKQALAFIKGYIDGDGHFRITKTGIKKGVFVFDVVSTAKMLHWMYDILEIKNPPNIYKAANNFRIKLANNRAKNIYFKLKQIDTPELKRKWNIL